MYITMINVVFCSYMPVKCTTRVLVNDTEIYSSSIITIITVALLEIIGMTVYCSFSSSCIVYILIRQILFGLFFIIHSMWWIKIHKKKKKRFFLFNIILCISIVETSRAFSVIITAILVLLPLRERRLYEKREFYLNYYALT